MKAAFCILGVFACFLSGTRADDSVWRIDTTEEWKAAADTNLVAVTITDGQAKSTEKVSVFRSPVRTFPEKRKAKKITLRQSVVWDNWREIDKVSLPEMADALIFLPEKPGSYWMLGRFGPDLKRKKGEKYNPRPQDLPGSKFAYHAWHSTDMKTWKHCGPVSDNRGAWMTTAEYADGKYYLYYDKPNDQDPHLIVDNDLGDGEMGIDHGLVFDDPTNGSDCGVLRDEDGRFHLIFEDWSYNNAKTHAWDSPVAGHAVSPDGISAFHRVGNAVDERTKATGKTGEFVHSSSDTPLTYEIHKPEQNAYGDWTAVKVGGQYYLFCDYDPVGKHIRVGRFTSAGIDKPFRFCGSFGHGHPDPSVGFAEGQFYLVQQQGKVDFVSPGPWVPGVEVRVGVDNSGDGKIDQWTDWETVAEIYKQKPGFARIVDTKPAQLDINELPSGTGFAFEYRTQEVEDTEAKVWMESVEIDFIR